MIGRWPRGRPVAFAAMAALAALALLVSLAVAARGMRHEAPLETFGELPSFHLVDQRGQSFSTSSMLGHVSVVDFIFTRCTSSCPRLTAAMASLQARLARARSDARLVSFSVDPENDTPSVLSDYAARAHADAARWTFVTGPSDQVSQAVVGGFKVSAAKVDRGANEHDVVHGNWFVLVDPQGRLRGYYATDDPGFENTVVNDVGRLERPR